MQEKKKEEEERLKKHSSGLQYYSIKLNAVESDGQLEIRLFESFSPGRLKWENDEETFDEYRIRRNYAKKADKELKKGQLVWNAKWGTFNQTNALKIQAALNENKDLI